MKRTTAFLALGMAALLLAGQARAMGCRMSSQSTQRMGGTGTGLDAGQDFRDHTGMTAAGSNTTVMGGMAGAASSDSMETPVAGTAPAATAQGAMAHGGMPSQMQGTPQASPGDD